MDGLKHPVGEQPTNVYWRRRVAVIAGIVVLGLLVWWIIGALTSGSAVPGSGATPDATITTSTSPTAAADLDRACTDKDINLETVPTKDSFSGDTHPTFTVTATHIGDSPCKLNTAAEGTELLIMSGSDRIFSSTDCPADATFGEHEYLMQPDAEQKLDLEWDRTRSEPGCKDVSATPGNGTYKATVTIGEVKAKAATFNLS